jgi:hypothetical protein
MQKKFLRIFFIFLVVLQCNAGIYAQDLAILHFDSSDVKGVPGYFRVGKTQQGQWWFLTPDNQPFFYKGVVAVNRAGRAGGRNAKPGPYAGVVDKKYNYQQSPDAFVKASIQTIRSLGFNSLGAWTTEEFFNKGMPFTEIIEFFKEPPFLPSVNSGEGLPDIFDSTWLMAVDKKARALCTPLRYSKELVGYFTDNEIGFGETDDLGLDPGFKAGQFDVSLLRLLLAMDSTKPAAKFAWNFLLNRYGQSMDALTAAWKIAIHDKSAIKKLNESKIILTSEAYQTDAIAFVKKYAALYFEIANRTIKRYDPNHLILGCRFGALPPTYVLDAIQPWTDVISANNYRPTLYERYDTLYNYTGLPILIGEISWNTGLFKNIPYPDEIQKLLSEKERMFRSGMATIERAATHNGFVGITWYRWVQGISTEKQFYDGVVNYNDKPDIHTVAQQQLFPHLEEIRLKAANGDWKYMPLNNGELTLFTTSLRPQWDQYLRISFVQGHPLTDFYGWQMKGSVLKSRLIDNQLDLEVRVDFAEMKINEKIIPPSQGRYGIHLQRRGEKWYGTLNGMYEGRVVAGNIQAFYFPEQKLIPSN